MKNSGSFISLLFLFVLTSFLTNCSKDDDVTKIEPDLEKAIVVEVTNIESSGVEIKSSIENFNISKAQIENHGFIWYSSLDKKSSVDLGALTSNSFSYKITNNLKKGITHYTYPYVVSKGKLFSGDTLSFTPVESSKVIFKDIFPLKGFIGDTIFVTGNNFCQESNRNLVLLSNDVAAHTVYESDTLIKALVSTFIKAPELDLVFKSCDTLIKTQKKYVINTPKFDSISSGEKYIGDVLTIYGENLHSSVSKVFIGNKEAQLVQNNYIDRLEIKVPSGLETGMLDIKLDVLGRIITKEKIFQSTTPYIEDLSSKKIGFLDTLSIKGNYFIQKQNNVEVYLGRGQQRVISVSKGEIKVVIDNGYLYDYNPSLKIKIQPFEYTEEIEKMLPPKIISFDKEIYHFTDAKMLLQTEHFIKGFECNLEIGEINSFSEGFLESVALNGVADVSLNTVFLESYPKYKMVHPGKIKVVASTLFGRDEKYFKIYAPVIQSINKSFFYANEYVTLTGTDFGYQGVTKIFIDGIEVPNPYNSSYTIYNKNISFVIPNNITPGNHTIKVVTGGQESNEINFKMAEISVSSFYPTTGTRGTRYTIEGNNFNNGRSTGVTANGKICSIASISNTKIEFYLPYYEPASNNISVVVSAGAQAINAGTINGIESHSKLPNTVDQKDYYGDHIVFNDENNWYYLHIRGVYKFNIATETWELFDSNKPIVPTNTKHQKYVRVVDNKADFFDGNKMYTYNLNNKEWSETTLNVDGSINNAVKINNEIFMIVLKDFVPSFYKYSLTDHTKTLISVPSGLYLSWESMSYNDGKIFIDPLSGDIYAFDTANETWEDLGHPYNGSINYYNTSLYYYNNKLYLSGGRTDVGILNTMYAYDFSLKQWKQRTPMLSVLEDHAVFGIGDVLYLGLGRGTYSYTNRSMYKYKISVDPQ